MHNQNRKTVIMQPYFFPYIPYFQLISTADIFVIYDDVNYINRGYINRNSILLNGNAHKVTLALCNASQNKLINEISIGQNTEKILKTIEFAYKKAPCFAEVFPLLIELLQYKEKNLARFIGNSIQIISKNLGLRTQFIYSSEIEKNNTLKGQDKIIHICEKLKTQMYINSIGGQKLYDKTQFEMRNMRLLFLKPELKSYLQFKNEFVPNLSILDVLMFNQKCAISNMLNQYVLI